VRHSLDDHASPEWRRIGRCWLGVLLIVMITGPVLAVAGIGGSLWALAGFLVIFGLAAAPLIGRGLRPSVTLVSSSEQTKRVPRQLPGAGEAGHR
jgi:hypothetical protein